MKMKSFGLIETKLFNFHRIFKNGGQGGFERISGSATGFTRLVVYPLHHSNSCIFKCSSESNALDLV